MGTLKAVCLAFIFLSQCQGLQSNGLVRYQRGDQGPDDDLHQTDISIDYNSVVTDTIVPPIGGPNVCRSRSRTFCCPGWHQRGSTGLCLVPVCSSNRCGNNGRCIKPNLCLCEGGKIAAHCGDGSSPDNEGCSAQCLNGGSCRNATCQCRPGYAGEHCQEPVCKKPCENGGRCIGPNRCACVYGYTGRYCEIDYRTGPCFRRIENEQCTGQLEGVVCTKQLCCATIGKAWGHPCEKCPDQLSCQPGFLKNVHTGNCMDINECEAIPGLCLGGECINNMGSFECQCPEGKSIDENHVCQDEDECTAFNNGQEICPNGKCINRDPGYICICDPGYIPSQDQTTCLDARQGYCYEESSQNQCRNALTFKMSRMDCCCNFGKSWGENRGQCQDCPRVNSNEHQDLCQGLNNNPSNQVRDICSTRSDLCPNGKCIPDQSQSLGYYCECDDGYEKDRRTGKCVDVDECNQGLCANGICRNKDGSFECTCPTGFHLSSDGKQCTDYNECQQTGMCANGVCSNMNGSFKCKCNDGYKLSISGLSCNDIDECRENPLICLHGRCRNTVGSYICECEDGYLHSSDGGFCIDKNECQDDNVCGAHGRCINNDGGYQCICDPGYVYERKTCLDIDECLTNPCISGNCINSQGSFKCECPDGFSLGPDGRTCADTVQGLCYAMFRQGQCVNPSNKMVSKSTCCCAALPFSLPKGWGVPCQQCPMPGSFDFEQLCPFGNGFTNSGDDINECAQNPKICGDHGACENIMGSYQCICDPGYEPDHTGKQCQDINECQDPLNCRKGQCRNTPGGFQCVCPSGMEYSESTKACEDIDECSDQNNKCPNGKCINTNGGYKCECQVGSSLDPTGTMCLDSRRGTCWRALNDVTSQCENNLLGLTLKNECCCSAIGIAWGSPCEKCNPSEDCGGCSPGMAMLDGKTCQDINECALDPTLCAGGVCVNTEGSYTCRCPPGLTLEVSAKGITSCSDERVEPCYLDYRQGVCTDDIGGLYKKDKCCCTLGEAWGFGCSQCPKPGTAAFDDLCPKGYGFVDNVDINECLAFPDMCQNGRCKNTLGGYDCRCNQGYALDEHGITCSNIDECSIMKGVCGNGTCLDIPGSFTCQCDAGFEVTPMMQVCMDINECERTPGLCRGGHCINTPGSFVCECPIGHEVSEDGKSCKDIDECSKTSGICSNGVCENMMGAYQCICDEGYKQAGSGTSCVDVDECADANGGCDDICINSPGSYSCACSTGFMLLLDGKQCKDIDECTETGNPCNGGKCINTPGGYSCVCSGGLMMGPEATSCLDLDECAVNEDVCKNGKCENVVGTFNCICDDGFSVKDKLEDGCTDDDECSLNIHHCNPMATCKNTNGSYDCVCNEGYSGDGYECKDINECLTNNGGCSSNARCINRNGGFQCVCDDGFSGDGFTCSDIDECTDDPTLCENGICLNDQGSFSCECQIGYMHPVASNTQMCVDINECERIENICMNGLCENTNGIFRCICDEGYALDENGSNCTDINECDDPQACQYGTCINTDGGFECQCPLGFELSSTKNGCLDSRKGTCYGNTTVVYNGPPICRDSMGDDVTRSGCCCSAAGKAWGDSCQPCPDEGSDEFKVVCPGGKGYRPNPGTLILEDINECNELTKMCDNGRCSNTFGSYMCSCNSGFELDAKAVKCVDIDECAKDSFICGVGQCVNSEGGFECVCPQGYMLKSDGKGCIDMRKEMCYMQFSEGACSKSMTIPQTKVVCCCSMGAAWGNDCAKCPQKGTQAYKQMCGSGSPGMMVDPVTGITQEIDECQMMPGMCQNGICMNTIGSFHCECYPGYIYDEASHQCIDNNECVSTDNPCKGNAKCINTPGGFECSCPDGYKLDYSGRSCKDIDECSERGRSICQNGFCTNMEGSFQCTCNEGFTLSASGDSCVDINECNVLPNACGDGTCINTFGSHRCRCNYGFQMTNGNTCEDIDECRSRYNICRNGRCKNTKGSFTCECTDGYKLSYDGMHCEDIDECSEKNACPSPGICENSFGAFICTCPEGYKLNSLGNACVDIDECQENTDFCQNGICQNSQGSATCQCQKGWQLSADSSTCIDMRQEPCYNDNQCSLSRPRNMTKQNCCCSYGKSWGKACESCPIEGSRAFQELCPLGPGRGNNGEDFDECQLLGPDLCDGGICINTDGSYRCECPAGYKLDSTGKKCIDDNECLSNANICGNGTCSNLDGSFECSCKEGFAPGPFGYCEDVDECVEYGHQCAFRCHNIPGSYRCICPYGYKLAPDGRHCIDINECESEANDCRYDCKNLIGTFICVCPEGFRKLGTTDECEDIDECAGNPDICQGGGTCINTGGSYICECKNGYELSADGTECLDRRLGYCYDRVLGGGRCRQTGVSGYANQQQIRVTKAECCCAMGAAWGSAEQSESTFGMSNTCEICPNRGTDEFDKLCLESGFGPEGQDIDECKTLPNLCENGQCINTLGSYRCICNRGYKPEPSSASTKCVDVNECLQRPGPCEHECTNSWGSYTCSCPQGYVLNSDGKTCRDLDECAAGTHTCQYECVNTLGAYECACPRGFRQMGDRCVDVDECIEQQGLCPRPGTCKNTHGSFKCVCPRGYRLDESGTFCMDRNECEEDANKCEASECRNLAGSYKCGCPDGFVLHNVFQECVDANECLESQNKICGSAKCQNSFGSFSCLCPSGYSYNGNMQVCVQSASGCGEASCAFGCNSVGSTGFDCQCPKGHQAVTGTQGQVSHCVALNNLDNFVQETDTSDVISTEGCFACQLNKPYGPQQSRRGRSRYNSQRSHNYHYSSTRRRTSRSRSRRRSKRHVMKATFTSIRPIPFALARSNSTELHDTSQYTKLSIKLVQEQTKHKRPILFIVPARTSNALLEYAIHGKNKDLFGLRHDPDGIVALYYLDKVVTDPPLDSVIHHVRVIGLKTRHARHHHHHEEKELNIKVKIVVVKKQAIQ